MARGRPKGSKNKKTIKKQEAVTKAIEKLKAKEKEKILAKLQAQERIKETAKKIEQDERDAKGRFTEAYNPCRGKPRNPYRQILNKISQDDFTKVKEVLMDCCLAGDIQAIQTLFKYVMPHSAPAEPLLGIKTKTAADLNESISVVIDSMAQGDISYESATEYIKCLESKRNFIQSVVLEEDIRVLKERVSFMGTQRNI